MADENQAADKRAQLSATKRALLEQRIRRAREGGAALPAAHEQRAENIPALGRVRAPLSFGQERLWFLDRLDPGGPLYNISVAWRLSGPLDQRALRGILAAIVRRHAILRTTFAIEDGQPVQIVAPPAQDDASLALPLIDLRGLPEPLREVAARRLIRALTARPFDLARGPLIRATLIRIERRLHLLQLDLHHIAGDSWSFAVFAQDLAALYQPGADPPDLPIQYADFAIWQRERLHEQPGQDPPALIKDQLAYWRGQLAARDGQAAPPRLELPTDHPRTAARALRGDRYSFRLPRELSEALAALSGREGCTLFMALFAAWATLLYRYAGQSDVVVGTPIAGRTHPQVEPLIGFFVNTLALRADLSGEPSFRALLGRVREMTLGAYAHQDIPFERLVEALQPERDLSRPPLFQTTFGLQNIPTRTLALAGLMLSDFDADTGMTHFDLACNLAERPDGLHGWIDFKRDLFDPPTIARMAGHFRSALAAAVADPDQSIARLALLTRAERQQLLVEWGAGPGVGGQEAGVRKQAARLHELFAAHAARAPDAIALVFDSEPARRNQGLGLGDQVFDAIESGANPWPLNPGPRSLTYGELDRRANQLAQRLRRMGAGHDRVVGISIAPSPELIIAVLGVLKAGAAYLPLDPNLPKERINFMLGDAGANLLVMYDVRLAIYDFEQAQGNIQHPTSNIQQRHDETELPSGMPEGDLDDGGSDANLAYVIYTSGSTGQPKGVAVTHANVARLFAATRGPFEIGAGDVWSMSHAISFDFSVWELWGALAHGGRLAIASEELRRAPALLLEMLDRQRVSVLSQTPAAFYQILDAATQPGARRVGLRLVIFGGEALDLARIRPWCARYGDEAPRLVNMYGITETTVHVTRRRLRLADLDRAGSLIGRPLDDLQLYLLDRERQPAPIGVAGELYVGGAGVARGYLGRPELTAERFIPNPFAKGSGFRVQGSDPDPRSLAPDPRLYRTGDLARYRPNGELEYIGRIDGQVKLRGYRIELGEIAAALRAHAAVRDAVAALREDGPGGPRIVAYVVPIDPTKDEGRRTKDEGGDSSLVTRHSSLAAELRGWLGARLPAYMVPAAFVFLDALPITPNGKLDRRALPAPDDRAGAEQAFVDPRTPIEELIAGAWADVLGVERVSVLDHFFDLGGHSLLATRLVARMQAALGVELPLRALFESPTIAELAARAEVAGAFAPPIAPPIVAQRRAGALPLSFAQQRLWFLDQLAPGVAIYKIPIALRLVGALDVAALARSLAAIIRRHAILRTTFELVEGRPAQVIAPPQPGARAARLRVIDLRGLPEDVRERAARRLATAEAERPFDLASGPLIRAALARLDDAAHVLSLTMHHIIADGWSMDILLRELTELYAAEAHGRAADLPDQPLQYADYALWQRGWIEGAQDAGPLQPQLDYWRAQLASLSALDLPTDHARPAAPSFGGATHAFALAPDLARELRGLGRRAGATPFMTLLAGWVGLLARVSGQDDVVVGSPIANRRWAALEDLIGCFVNTLALRADLRGDPSFADLLARVRQTCLDAYAHQDLPFELLVEALRPERAQQRQPLFQVFFALQNAPRRADALAELALSPIVVESETATFELALNLLETPAGIEGVFEYSVELFEAATIERLARQLAALLHTAVAQPARPLGALPLCSPSERHQLLAAQPRAAFPIADTLPQRFAAQVASTPDAIALVADHTQLSYAALLARADALAPALQQRGSRPDALVALACARPDLLIIGLLASLRAGSAYLPLDPSAPPARLAALLADARPALLLTQTALRASLGDLPLPVVCLDQPWPPAPPAPPRPPARRPDHLAYVIYTSGSTGQPKGVAVTHANVLRLFAATHERFRFSARDAWPLCHSAAFDFSVWEIWGALLYGGRLIGLTPAQRRQSDAVAALIARERISVLNQTPSAFVALAPRLLADARAPHDLRLVIFGGEALDLAPLRRWVAQVGDARPQLVNMYGITETTVHVTAQPLSAAQIAQAPGSPIGAPLADLQLYLLDGAGDLAGIGVVGELYVGGSGLARGYLGRPDLTAERFLPNPLPPVGSSQVAGGRVSMSAERRLLTADGRLYKTGDRARYRTDGTLEYLGRADDQVKLRGYRIELGEIAATLAQHAAVQACVVVPQADGLGGQRLVAYVVPTPDAGAPSAPVTHPAAHGADASRVTRDASLAGALRAFLAARLPAYMLPAAFVALDALPLTANGKLDRRALPPPDPAQAARARPLIAPRTPIEAQLAALWRALLGVAEVGIADNFFELGGHSLLLTQLAARINDEFGVDLPLRILFDAPTIVDMTIAIADQQIAQTDADELAQLMQDLDQLSPDEVATLFAASG